MALTQPMPTVLWCPGTAGFIDWPAGTILAARADNASSGMVGYRFCLSILSRNTQREKWMQLHRSEVLIIGGGISGITTTLDLLDGGKSVVLLDRDEASAFGGLARESFGGMFFVDSPEQRRLGIRDSADLALRDWHDFAEFGAEDFWPRAWAQAYVERCTTDIYRWVRGHGVRFLPVVNWVERGEFRPGNSVLRFHVTWGTGKGLAETLIGALRGHANAKRLTVHFRHRVERLLTRDGRVEGCEGVDETSDMPFEARAENVVVAGGGINGDLDRVRQNWHRDWNAPPAKLLNGSHRFADGRLHDAAVAAGGVVSHLDKMWNYAAGVHHPRPRKPHHGLSLVPPRRRVAELARRADRTAASCVGLRHARLVTDICAQQRHTWQIMNRRIALEGARGLRRRTQSVDPRQEAAGFRAPSARQPLAGEGDDRSLPGFRRCRDPAGAGGKDERCRRPVGATGGGAECGWAHDATIARGRSLMNDEQLRRIAECANIAATGSGCASSNGSTIPGRCR
jgi:hypothetical protein